MANILMLELLLWAGMILGISFLESWAKFKAPSLTKAIGLDVGRTVYKTFHQVQWGLLSFAIAGSILLNIQIKAWLLLTAIGTIVMTQSLLLFPKLNQRVDIILSGHIPPASFVHSAYGILEIIKFLLLITINISLDYLRFS